MTALDNLKYIKTTTVACPLCGAVEYSPLAAGPDFDHRTSRDEFHIVRCRPCGVLYLNPRPDVSELNRIYPVEYGAYHFNEPVLTFRLRNYLEQRKVRLLLRLLPGSADLLDVGCGGAGFLERLRKFGSRGWRLWGNEINPDVLADLNRRGFKTLPGKFEELDQPECSFDAIIFKQVLEHFEYPRDALRRAARLLRPGGVAVIETPNCGAWDARLFRRRYWAGYCIPRHWTVFDPRTLSRLSEEEGLAVESFTFLPSPSFWTESVRNMFMDKGWPPVVYRRFTNRSTVAMGLATMLDLLQQLVTGRTSNMRAILRKPAR